MTQTVERSSPLKEFGHFVDEVKVQDVLSELVIPAVPGEFYSYAAKFTKDRSLYVFMKCKANKARPLAAATELGSECNLVFLFGEQPLVCSIRAALGDPIGGELFGETWVAPAGITTEDFYELRSRKDEETLVDACRAAFWKREELLALNPGMVIAMMTDAGKYGMFVVKELTPVSIEIDAWHILL